MEITFHKIKRQNIFCSEFENLTRNNSLIFSDCGIIVIYGPNGIGKTSLTKALGNEESSKCEFSIDGERYSNPDPSLFHIIQDQNGRNIIQGSTEDFILGDNIHRELQLKSLIESDFVDIFKKIGDELKQSYGISKKSSNFDSIITNNTLREYISDIANAQSKGKRIDEKNFLEEIKLLSFSETQIFDDKKYYYFIDDYKNGKLIIEKIKGIRKEKIAKDTNIRKLVENDDAIKILNKYDYLDECIVCDNEIDRLGLIERKSRSKEQIFQALDQVTKELLSKIINTIDDSNDPFKIKENVLSAINLGDFSTIESLNQSFYQYQEIFNQEINNIFAHCLFETELIKNYKEYELLLKEKPEFSEEDILFIQTIINDCIEKKIELRRDSEKNINLFIGDKLLLCSGPIKLDSISGFLRGYRDGGKQQMGVLEFSWCQVT